jgi:flagellar basal-body rod protein FlgF
VCLAHPFLPRGGNFCRRGGAPDAPRLRLPPPQPHFFARNRFGTDFALPLAQQRIDMIYGMYLSAAGALVEDARQNVIANNLANSLTAGFKPDQVVFSARLTEAQERNDFRADVNPILERLGGGVFVDEISYQKRQGAYTQSSNPFHVALKGDGLFAVTDGASTYYTRAGNFQLGPDGTLLTADGSYRVQSVEGQPIRVEGEGASNVTIDEQGVMWVGSTQAGQLKVVGRLDPKAFTKVGDNLYQARPGVEPAPAPGTTVHQFLLEDSAVNSIQEMVALIKSYRAFEANMRILRLQDETLGKTVNEVAKLA